MSGGDTTVNISTPLAGSGQHNQAGLKIINKRLNIEMDQQQASNLPLMNDEGDKSALHRRRHSRGFSKTIQMKPKHPEQAVNATDPKWTPDQLFSHYSQCLKLSQENKINHKNAFELHLIDHMQRFITKDGTTNFLVAGGTIYAGAKIYASRVDALSTILNRLILSLASGGKDEDDGETRNEEFGGELDPSARPKARKKKRNCQVLETQESNLRVTSIPQTCLANLLQRREGRSVDAANCSYLATNQYKQCKDEVGIKYVEESNQRVLQHDHDIEATPPLEDENTPHGRKGNLFTQLMQSNYVNELNKLDSKKLANVDSLNSFDFDSVDTGSNFVDIPAPTNPFADELETAAIDGVDEISGNIHNSQITDDDDDNMGGGCHDDDDVMDFQPPGGVTAPQHTTSTMKCSGMIHHDDVETFSAITSDALDPARLVALKPGEYSFFQRDAVPICEGTESWLKMKNAQATALKKQEEKASETSEKSKTGPPSKRRKAPQKTGVDLNEPKISSEKTRGLQKMSAAKKDQMRDNKSKLVTLEKCEITKADLMRAMLARVYIRPLELEFADFGQVEQDDLTQAVSHSNTDFCPPIIVGNHGDDDDDHHDDDYDDGGDGFIFNPNAATSNLEDDERTTYTDMLDGDHLVEGPKKMETVGKINFANMAKRMDVKKLKEALWRDMREKVKEKKKIRRESQAGQKEEPTPATETETNMNCEEVKSADKAEATTEKDKEIMREVAADIEQIRTDDDALLFSQTYESLPNKLSGGMRESLSIPIAFTCLLHLANEKQLEVQSLPDLKDVVIKLPSTTNDTTMKDVSMK